MSGYQSTVRVSQQVSCCGLVEEGCDGAERESLGSAIGVCKTWQGVARRVYGVCDGGATS